MRILQKDAAAYERSKATLVSTFFRSVQADTPALYTGQHVVSDEALPIVAALQLWPSWVTTRGQDEWPDS